MVRRGFVLNLLLIINVLSWGALASAEHPTTLTHYRFLPRFSVLNESGGIAGVDVDFRVLGKFDLVIDNDHQVPWQNSAKFENVDAWASHPILAYVLNVDDVLNLSGLTGTQLPVAGPFDAYRFEGFAQDGSSVDLIATVLGPWLYLNGGTTPPEGSADYFVHEIRALARSRPFADFDDNGIVDSDDFVRWREHFGDNQNGIDIFSWGDADGDQDVDGRDFLIWQRQAGEMAPPLASLEAATAAARASLVSVSAVPEPGTLLLATMGTIVFIRRWNRRTLA